jgi:phospholipid/cholesterol/gamma-HCH transport system substrate-binding protein
VGLIVITGTIFIIGTLYTIGDRQNLFSSTFQISARFYNVNGLMEGNNVRLSGIDVGTVESIEIINDSAVHVVMNIENDIRRFIKKNALVSVGTDGLVGNKLVNINSVPGSAESVEDGDVLQTLKPIETDEMLRTLNTTNDNIRFITIDLKNITDKINNSNSVWSLLADTMVADNVKNAILQILLTGNRSASITADLSEIVQNVRTGKGSLGTLLTDSSLAHEMEKSLTDIRSVSRKMAIVATDLESFLKEMEAGDGTVRKLMTDTAFANNLNQSLENIKKGSKGFEENMEALKHNVFFRKYFKKAEKKKSN